MIGIDTNVLVRYLVQDEPAQSARATRIIERELTETSRGFISVVVLVEASWVLQCLYRVRAAEFLETVRDLLDSRTLSVENREVVTKALAICETNGCGFADAIIAAACTKAGCTRTVTFDRGAVRAGMTLASR